MITSFVERTSPPTLIIFITYALFGRAVSTGTNSSQTWIIFINSSTHEGALLSRGVANNAIENVHVFRLHKLKGIGSNQLLDLLLMYPSNKI